MKYKLQAFLFSALLSLSSVAADSFDIKNIAEKIKDDYYAQGHRDVESHEAKVDNSYLDEYLLGRFEEDLNTDQVEELYHCIEAENCNLYLVKINLDYMGGYGIVSHFILQNCEQGTYSEISHLLEAE